MEGWYEIKSNEQGQYSFVLKAANSEVILRSESYESRAAAENGVESVRVNSALDERYERLDAVDGRSYFNLRAANHQVIGTSQMYRSPAGRDKGIESVRRNAPAAALRTVEA